MATSAPRLGLQHVTVVPANYGSGVDTDDADDAAERAVPRRE